MKIYKKLVRDKIPEIIEKDNLVPICRTLNNKEYQIELNKKLVEEVKEYLESQETEELADIVEVIYSIVKLKNISLEDFEKIRIDKVEKRGSFDKKIFLEREEEKKVKEPNWRLPYSSLFVEHYLTSITSSNWACNFWEVSSKVKSLVIISSKQKEYLKSIAELIMYRDLSTNTSISSRMFFLILSSKTEKSTWESVIEEAVSSFS